MTQKQIFLKNIVDSTMSIDLERYIGIEKLKSFHFDQKVINDDSVKFEYTLKNTDTKYFFNISLYKVSKKGFFGTDKSKFYLRVETRVNERSTCVDTDFITNETCDVVLLKKMFNFLNDRIEQRRLYKEEESYLLKNKELAKLIDKSLTRDEKLKDLLQDK
jgi:hypothetical protein